MNEIRQTNETKPADGAMPPRPPKPDALLWLDIETTGLGPDAKILEVGMRCTSMDAGEDIAEGEWVVRPSELSLYDLDTKTLAMHAGNGLLREVMCSDPDVTGPDAVNAALEAFVGSLAREHTLHPAGSNVQRFDLPVLRRFLGYELDAVPDWMDIFLSYRALDVTALRLTLMASGVNPYGDRPAKPHRVMDCIDEDVRFYRDYLAEYAA